MSLQGIPGLSGLTGLVGAAGAGGLSIPDPTAFWRFESFVTSAGAPWNAVGTKYWKDEVSNRHLKISNNAAAIVAGGKHGNGWDCPGDTVGGEYAYYEGALSPSRHQSFTFYTWYSLDSKTPNNYDIFGGTWSDANTIFKQWMLQANHWVDRYIFTWLPFGTTTPTEIWSTYPGIPTGQYVFTACVHDAENDICAIYVNGTYDTVSFSTGIREMDSANGWFYLNNIVDASRQPDGKMDSTGFHLGTALSRTQLDSIYAAGAGREYYSGAWH